MVNFLKAALEYEKLGMSVIPCLSGQKKPAIAWQGFQQRRATPEEIVDWWHQWPTANIGIVTGKISNLLVVDLDKYKKEFDNTVELEYFDSISTPVVESPNGGNHLYFSYAEGISIASGVFPAVDIRGEGGYIIAPPSVNGNGKPYNWIVSLKEQSIAALPVRFQAHIYNNNNIYNNTNTNINNNTLYNNVRSSTNSQVEELTSVDTVYKCLQEGNRNSDIFTVAMSLAKGKFPFESAKEVIDILAKNANPPYNSKEAYESLKSAYKRADSKERNIHDEVREYVLQQKCLHEADIVLKDCLHSLQLLTRQEKMAGYQAIHRICNDEKLLEKQEGRRGVFRILDDKVNEAVMDLLSEPDIKEFNVKLPLELNDYCVVSPGNIIVVSGSKSSGKTALLMNIAWLNQDRFEVHYLNSEMHETEFKKRMKKFAPLNKWHIRGYKCHKNFADFIQSDPKKVYIIDFMEIHDNFYEIGSKIRTIHEKIGDSICFIAIQMKGGAALGRGGDFSAEKARLYLTMDFVESELKTRVTIYDAKEPRPPYESLRGVNQMVKIVEGNHLSGAGWLRNGLPIKPRTEYKSVEAPPDCSGGGTKWYEKF